MNLLQKLEAVGEKYKNADELKLRDSFVEIDEFTDDENPDENDPDGVEIEDEQEEDDYKIFTDMLAEGHKEIVERKKHWADTGDSFVLDNFSETTRIQDWVKEHIEDADDCNLDISTVYSDLCKKKKLQSTFLEQNSESVVKNLHQVTLVTRTPKHNFRPMPKLEENVDPLPIKRRNSTTLSPIKKDSKSADPCTPSSSANKIAKVRPSSESTHNRRTSGAHIHRNPRLLMKHPARRLSTVPESPSVLPKSKPIRRTVSVDDTKMPKERTIIYSPMQPLIDNRFEFVLKSKTFDPHRMFVFEPFSDLETTDSDEDVFMTLKKEKGGRVYQI